MKKLRYTLNSELLAKSLLDDNIKYTLLTNNKKKLDKIYTSPILNIKEINFKTKIIKGPILPVLLQNRCF